MAAEQQKFFYKHNRLQQLRGFCYVAEFGSVTRAAKHMGLSQSSVSLQIKALSEDLGVMLIARFGPHIELTDEGRRLLKIVQPLVDGIQNLPQVFSEIMQVTERTQINIGLNSTSLNFIFPRLAKRYISDYADSRFIIHFTEHHEAMAKILSEEIDLAILPRRMHLPFPQEFKYIPLFEYTPALITRTDHPLAGRKKLKVEEILQYELILPAKDLRVIDDLYNVFDPHDTRLKLRIEFKDWETGRKYIEEDVAISISSDVIIGENDTLVATPLDHLFDMVDYGIVVKRDKPMPDKIEKLIAIANQLATTRRLQSSAKKLKA